MKEQQQSNAWGVASLVTGICSIALFLAPYISVPLGIFAMVSFGVQNKKHPNGVATAGLITGIIGTVIGVIFGVMALILLAAMGSSI